MSKLTPEQSKEIVTICKNLQIYKEPKYAAEQMGLSIDTFNDKLREHNIPPDLGYRLVDVSNIRENISTFQKVTQLINSAVPKEQTQKFKDAELYATTDDLLNSITRTKMNFGMADFHVQSSDKMVQDFCDGINREVDMDALIQQMWDKIATQSNAPFYYDISGKTINDIQIIDPKLLEVYPLYSQNKKGRKMKAAILRMPAELKSLYAVRNQAGYKDLKSMKYLDKLPADWKKALNKRGVGKGRDGIEIYEDDGKFLRIINHKAREDKLVDPEMTAIFKQIRLRHLMIEGDYGINYHIKSMIHQIKVGNSISKNAPEFLAKLLAQQGLTTEQAQKIKDAYATIEHVMLEVTDDTVTHEFHAPDVKYLEGRKYVPIETQILRWGGIALVLLDAENANYSGGYIYIKALIADIMKWRRRIERVLQAFYLDLAPAMGRKSGLAKKMLDPATRPRILFSDHIMKEPKQLLEEVRFMLTNGGIDWQTAHEWLGVSHNITKARMKRQWTEEDYKYFYPLYEMHQGMLVPYNREPIEPKEPPVTTKTGKQPGEPGNPGDGDQKDRDGGPRQPRNSD